jgi:Nucleotidyl transferase AbiEii toxin, Type IV TA system
MRAAFTPKLETLPPAQRVLWMELQAIPPEFVLYGGTAIALYLGHRESVDFDLFGAKDFNPVELYRRVPLLKGAQVLQQERNTLTCSVERDGDPVKVSFFGVPNLRRIEASVTAPDNGLKVASLVDLAGMKAAVVQQRAEAKDYFDLDALMRHGIDLPLALVAALAIYGEGFNPQITLKALSYFGDGNLHALPDEVKRRLVDAVAEVDLDQLPTLKCVPPE